MLVKSAYQVDTNGQGLDKNIPSNWHELKSLIHENVLEYLKPSKIHITCGVFEE